MYPHKYPLLLRFLFKGVEANWWNIYAISANLSVNSSFAALIVIR